MASFNAVNYSLRPNKSVERKIVFNCLSEIGRIVDLRNYRFVGLGSMWFVDFLMAHKALGINDMLSIEEDEIGHRRAEFNRPLACIKCLRGETTAVLPGLDLSDRPTLLWLDYDTGISGPVLEDASLVISKLLPDSIYMVTISAKKDDLPNKDENNQELTSEDSLRRIVGDLAPPNIPAKRFQRDKFPALVGEILENHLNRLTLRSGRDVRFVKMIDLIYSDSTPMITVGGVITQTDRIQNFGSLVQDTDWLGIQSDHISLPPLTLKEKMALDRLMPSVEAPSQHQVGQLGFMLKKEQIDTYHRYYRQYPVFGEFSL